MSLENEFRSRGVMRNGELFLRPADAIAMVSRARELGVEILGVDAFHLTDTTIQPDLSRSVTFSGVTTVPAKLRWDRAEVFLSQQLQSDLYFQVCT